MANEFNSYYITEKCEETQMVGQESKGEDVAMLATGNLSLWKLCES